MTTPINLNKARKAKEKADAEQRAHAEGPHFILAEHRQFDSEIFQVLCRFDEGFRVDDVGGFRNKVAGARDAGGNGGKLFMLGFGPWGTNDIEIGQRRFGLWLHRRAIFVEAIAA